TGRQDHIALGTGDLGAECGAGAKPAGAAAALDVRAGLVASRVHAQAPIVDQNGVFVQDFAELIADPQRVDRPPLTGPLPALLRLMRQLLLALHEPRAALFDAMEVALRQARRCCLKDRARGPASRRWDPQVRVEFHGL